MAGTAGAERCGAWELQQGMPQRQFRVPQQQDLGALGGGFAQDVATVPRDEALHAAGVMLANGTLTISAAVTSARNVGNAKFMERTSVSSFEAGRLIKILRPKAAHNYARWLAIVRSANDFAKQSLCRRAMRPFLCRQRTELPVARSVCSSRPINGHGAASYFQFKWRKCCRNALTGSGLRHEGSVGFVRESVDKLPTARRLISEHLPIDFFSKG